MSNPQAGFYTPYTERYARAAQESQTSWTEIAESGEPLTPLSNEEYERLEAEQFIRETGISENVANALYHN